MGIRAALGHPTIVDIANQLQRDGVRSVEINLRAEHIPNGGPDSTRAVLRAILSTKEGSNFRIGQVNFPWWLGGLGDTGVAQTNRLKDELLRRKVGALEARGIAVLIDGKTPQEVREGLEAFGYSTELQRGRR